MLYTIVLQIMYKNVYNTFILQINVYCEYPTLIHYAHGHTGTLHTHQHISCNLMYYEQDFMCTHTYAHGHAHAHAMHMHAHTHTPTHTH